MKKHPFITFITLLIGLSSFFSAMGQGVDLRLLESINGPGSGADGTWRTVSKSVYITSTLAPATMLVTGLATHNRELTVQAFETGGATLIAAGLTAGLKKITHRERPYLAHPDVIFGKSSSPDYSFPSGHTSVAFATATSLSLAFPKWYVIAPSFAYAGAVGYSRMYLGVHYPSDVLAGAVVGTGSAFLTWKLQKLLNKKYHYHQDN
ncbi:MAG: phosphatase PAP2 family protein [Bacteroidota bacterium]